MVSQDVVLLLQAGLLLTWIGKQNLINNDKYCFDAGQSKKETAT
jgi:hypothetical protein